MSRHEIPTKNPQFTASIGWDNAMQTYFCQVIDTKARENSAKRTPVWVGTDLEEIRDPAALREPLAPYAVLTPAHVEQLAADRARHAGTGPTAFQLGNLAGMKADGKPRK